MAQDPVARVVAERVKELRQQRGMSAQKLADHCAHIWRETQLDRDVIANLENGRRRSVSIDEVLVLAGALMVTPVELMTPSEGDLQIGDVGDPPFDHAFELTPAELREWLSGRVPPMAPPDWMSKELAEVEFARQSLATAHAQLERAAERWKEAGWPTKRPREERNDGEH
jgi:transcriptional regulator with XRE-family HTH domain